MGFKKSKNKHLTYEHRAKIEDFLDVELNVSTISEKIGLSKVHA